MTDASESIDLDDLKEGLRQSAAGETVTLGSFAKYADDIDLAELERLAKAATPGPWSWYAKQTVDGDSWAVFDRHDNALAVNADGWMLDAEFIAATDPSTVLTLIARLRDAEERVERFDEVGAYAALREELSRVREAHTVHMQLANKRLRKAEARIEKAEDYVTRHYLDTTVGERILAALTEGGEQ